MANRKSITPEQKAKAEARRAQFRQLVKSVAAMSDAERLEILNRCGETRYHSGRWQKYLKTKGWVAA